jgi:hypothetical protein
VRKWWFSSRGLVTWSLSSGCRRRHWLRGCTRLARLRASQCLAAVSSSMGLHVKDPGLSWIDKVAHGVFVFTPSSACPSGQKSSARPGLARVLWCYRCGGRGTWHAEPLNTFPVSFLISPYPQSCLVQRWCRPHIGPSVEPPIAASSRADLGSHCLMR